MWFPTGTQHSAGPFKIMWRVNAKRNIIDQGDIDPHTGLECTKLLESFTDFQRRRWKRDKSP